MPVTVSGSASSDVLKVIAASHYVGQPVKYIGKYPTVPIYSYV